MSRIPRRSTTLGLVAVMALLTAGSAHAASITAPDVVFTSGTSGTVSIAYTNATTSYTGIDLVLRYDSDVATPGASVGAPIVTIVALGNPGPVPPPDSWDVATNVIEDVAAGGIDELRISAASSGPLALAPGGTTLLDISFTASTATTPTSTALTFELAELNEAAVSTTDGSIAIGGVDGTVSLTPSTLLPGAAVTVTVTDADLTGTGGASARVINSTSGDVETVSLTETPASSGIFVGSIATAFDGVGSAAINGTVGVQKNDALTAEFDDALAADGTAKTVAPAPGGDVTILGGTTGAVGLSMSSPYPGGDIDVLLTDPDLQGDGVAYIYVINSTSGDSEWMPLSENPSNSGIFPGAMATVFDDGSSPLNNGVIGVTKDDVLTLTYADALNDIGGPETVSPAPGTDITILGGDTGDLSLSPASLAPGSPMTIQLIDADLVNTGSIIVTVTNSTTGDTESVTLTETPAGSGIFVGTINTEFDGGASGNSGNGLLGIKSGDTVTASYDDARNDDGGPETVGPPPGGELTISGGTNGTVAIAPVSITPGGLVTVTVVDADLSGSVDVTVRSRNSGGTEKETVTATLTQTVPGTFVGTVSTVFGVAVSAGGGLDVQKDDEIEAEYADALTSTGGVATLISPTTTLVLGGVLGVVETSAGVQAGDGFRIELTDADLNISFSVKETASITVTNVTGGDIEVVTVEETDVNTGIFRVVPPLPTSSSGSAGDGTLQVSPQDAITITYDDQLDAIGGVTSVVGNASGTRWGDTSKNGTVRALDAALILQENVALITFDDYQNLVGDVNPSATPGAVPNPTADDASKILQYAVGLISAFPAQTGIPNPHPYKRLNVTRRLAVGEPQVVDGIVRLSILADDVEGLLAGNLTLSFDAEHVKVRDVTSSERTEGFAVASKVDNGRLNIAFAGADIRGAGEGALLDIEVEALQPDAISSLRLEQASLNGGDTPAVLADNVNSLSLPQSFALLQNWPNPFNPETQVRYQVAEDGPVSLRIYDMTGQTIAALVNEHQSAGTYTVRWNGLNEAGHAVATGMYFYRLEAGGKVMTRKMSLVR